VAGIVQKIQKIQKCDVHCELVCWPYFLYIDMMINGVISYVFIYLVVLHHRYWLWLGLRLDKCPELSWNAPNHLSSMSLHSTIHPLGIVLNKAQGKLNLIGYIALIAFMAMNWIWYGSVMVKVPCYKPEGRGFETRWGEWFLSSSLILPVALGPGIYSAYNRNEYQKHKNNVSGE
jgi:hypothetical protein